MMDSAEKGKAFEQAIMPAQMLSQVPYFSRDERRKILPSITLKEVLAYRDALKSGARPEFMVIGNMTEAQATTLARDVQKQLGADGSEWCRNKDVVVDKKQSVIFEKAGNSTDSALAAVFVPTGYDEYTSSAYSSLLGRCTAVVLQSVAYRRTIGLCRVCVSNERGASVGHGLPFAKQ